MIPNKILIQVGNNTIGSEKCKLGGVMRKKTCHRLVFFCLSLIFFSLYTLNSPWELFSTLCPLNNNNFWGKFHVTQKTNL